MKKLLFVFNQYSGKARIRTQLLGLVDQMNKAGYQVTVWVSQHPKHIIELIQTEGMNYSRVVCSGGDGTLNEVMTGLMLLPADRRPTLGYIPAGSTNDVASGLGIPSNMQKAAAVAVGEHVFPLDIGRFGERYFTYVAAFGAFTEVAYLTPQQSKNILGHPAYILEGAKRLSSIHPIHVRVDWDKGSIDDEVLLGMVTNAKSVGGFKGITGKSVGLNDGVFEVTMIKKPVAPLINYPAIVTALLARNTENDSNFYTLKGRFFRFRSEEVSWTLDGEFGGSKTDVEIENCKHAVNILVP